MNNTSHLASNSIPIQYWDLGSFRKFPYMPFLLLTLGVELRNLFCSILSGNPEIFHLDRKDTRKEIAENPQDELMPENVKISNTACMLKKQIPNMVTRT